MRKQLFESTVNTSIVLSGLLSELRVGVVACAYVLMLIIFTFGRVRAFARLAAVLLDMIFTIHLNRQTDTNTRGTREQLEPFFSTEDQGQKVSFIM